MFFIHLLLSRVSNSKTMAHRCLYTMWMRAITRELADPKPCRPHLEWLVSQLEKSVAAEKSVNEYSRRLIDELAADLD